MKEWKKAVVYRSRDEADWTRAKELLAEAGIAAVPFAAEEMPVAGCGAKIRPGNFLNFGDASPTKIYRIEVAASDKERAAAVLEGKVLPVRDCGFSL
ncbi:MAG: hypothetical protein IJS96_04835 [Schwartzia sp.]|nr:hypothetical protein [Schwartzia sp. (in: firmicutes)]